MGVAVSAVSGCVAVDAGPPPLPSAGKSTPSASGPEVEPQIVQAPAREALEAAVSAPRETPSARPSPGVGATGRGVQAAGPGNRPSPPPQEGRTPGRTAEKKRRPAGTPPPATDVCALGETYGGWAADSLQARICRDSYGP